MPSQRRNNNEGWNRKNGSGNDDPHNRKGINKFYWHRFAGNNAPLKWCHEVFLKRSKQEKTKIIQLYYHETHGRWATDEELQYFFSHEDAIVYNQIRCEPPIGDYPNAHPVGAYPLGRLWLQSSQAPGNHDEEIANDATEREANANVQQEDATELEDTEANSLSVDYSELLRTRIIEGLNEGNEELIHALSELQVEDNQLYDISFLAEEIAVALFQGERTQIEALQEEATLKGDMEMARAISLGLYNLEDLTNEDDTDDNEDDDDEDKKPAAKDLDNEEDSKPAAK